MQTGSGFFSCFKIDRPAAQKPNRYSPHPKIILLTMTFCGLCREEKEIVDSHLIPKSLYKAIRFAYPEKGNEIILGNWEDKSAFYSDYQVKAPFLCKSCEDRLNKNGEKLIAAECYRGRDNFVLLEKIKKCNSIHHQKNERCIDPRNYVKLNRIDYIYFALSIIWRASAGKWPKSPYLNKNLLGLKYEEQIRKFLLGESRKLDNIFIGVYVDNDVEKYPLIIFPTVSKKEGYHHHIFFIPGIKFSIIIGAKTGGVEKHFNALDTKVLFFEYSFSKSKNFKTILKGVKGELKPRGRLEKDS